MDVMCEAAQTVLGVAKQRVIGAVTPAKYLLAYSQRAQEQELLD
jgi:hypothetical protein